MLLLLLQVPLALLDELVHGWGSLGWRNGCSRGQRGLGQGGQGRGWLQLWGLLLADDWWERRKGGPHEEAIPRLPLWQFQSLPRLPPTRTPARCCRPLTLCPAPPALPPTDRVLALDTFQCDVTLPPFPPTIWPGPPAF